MKQKMALGVGAAVMTVAGALSVAPAASASPAAQAAPAAADSGVSAAACANPLHTYQYKSYTGGWKKFCSSDNYLANNKFSNGGKVNDHIRSAKNLSRGCYWLLSQNYYQRGRQTSFKPWSWDANLSNNNVGYKTSSVYKYCG
ncbi:hypothetical protein ACWGJ2_14790 [Streptomyces sp. NPDC054796]